MKISASNPVKGRYSNIDIHVELGDPILVLTIVSDQYKTHLCTNGENLDSVLIDSVTRIKIH